MQRKAGKYLFDMREACDLVAGFASGKDFEAYVHDPLLRSAIERQLQIIGEALHQLSKAYPEVASQVPSHRDIINFRHILVHGYDRVANEVVYGVVKRNVPELRVVLDDLLARLD